MENISKRLNKFNRNPILYLIIANVIIAIIITRDYGESVDEHLHVDYGRQTSYLYEHYSELTPPIKYGNSNLQYYGPFFDSVSEIIFQFTINIFPTISIIPTKHFLYFIFFQIGVFSLYNICIRFLSPSASFLSTFLFSTQPLLWGHAFINPKDIPFMGFFLLCIASGLWLKEKIDKKLPHFQNSLPNISTIKWGKLVTQDWVTLQGRLKKLLLGFTLIYLTTLILSKFIFSISENLIENLVFNAYSNPSTIFGRLFLLVSKNSSSIPVETYISKATLLLDKLGNIWMVTIPIVLGTILFFNLEKTKNIVKINLFLPTIKALPKLLFTKEVIITGILIGLTTSIRILGPFAGGLIAYYLLLEFRERAIPYIISIAVYAILGMYISWPYLWPNLIGHFFKSLIMMMAFPWNGKIKFDGQHFIPSDLPRNFFPKLLSIQLTEPLLILLIISIFIIIAKIWKKKEIHSIIKIVVLWFFPIFLTVMVFTPTMYNNFRQFLFIIPPLFILAGLAIEYIFQKLSLPIFKWGFIFIVLFPGINSIIILHPYQYIYYNSFVSQEKIINLQYEADYWTTSFKPAIEFLNLNAPENSKIVVLGSHHMVERIARPDLIVEPAKGGTYNFETGYDFAILPTKWNRNKEYFTNSTVIFEESIDGILLSVVKQIDCPIDQECE